MGSRSYIFVCIIISVMLTVGMAKQSLQLKRDTAFDQVIQANQKVFHKNLKKALRLNSKFIKKLQHHNDSEISMLVTKATAYSDMINSKGASRDSIVENLKQQNAILRVIEQKISFKSTVFQPKSDTISASDPVSGKISEGQTDFSPAKKVKRTDDYFEPTLAIPLEMGRRIGIDKLIEDE